MHATSGALNDGAYGGGVSGGMRMALAVCPLYVAFGFAMGLIQIAIPGALQRGGLSMERTALLALLFLPFAFSAVWAPAIDHFRLFGRERRVGWIICCQVLTGCALVVAGAAGVERMGLLVLALATLAIAAATMDAALDGYLALHSVSGQLARRGGLKIGSMYFGTMLGSTLALLAMERVGWFTVMACAAALVMLALGAFLGLRPPSPASTPAAASASLAPLPFGFGEAVRRRAPMLLLTGAALGLGLSAPRLLLVEREMALPAVGLIFGPVSMAGGLLGAVVGGEAGRRYGVPRALAAAGSLFIVAMAAFAALSLTGLPTIWTAGPVVAAAAIAYGAMFGGVSALALGWARTRRASGDYALVQSIWYASIIGGGALAGLALSHLGAGAFVLAAVCVGCGLLMLARMRTPSDQSKPADRSEFAQTREAAQ